MYITSVRIDNFRSIRRLNWAVPGEHARGWHVIIGPNGSGKTSFLRAISLFLLGARQTQALLIDLMSWIRNGANGFGVRLDFDFEPDWDSGLRKLEDGSLWHFDCAHPDDPVTPDDLSDDRVVAGPEVSGGGLPRLPGMAGFFSAAFGPFRRFTGGDREHKQLIRKKPLLGAHLSVFKEGFALTESLEWLETLRFKELEGEPEGRLLKPLKEFINQGGFLPFDTRLEEVSSDGVRFIDGAGCGVPIEELSDGYRSILSMALELIRQLSLTFGSERIFDPSDATRVQPPGVVLIDEIDAHLHPTWQRRIGTWLCQHFPNLQFIVTTHSALICQAAGEGSVFVLSPPGAEEGGRMLEGTAFQRLVYGNVLEAYGSGAFGSLDARSDRAQADLDRLAELNLREIEEGLSDDERTERDRLRAVFPTESHPLAASHAAGS